MPTLVDILEKREIETPVRYAITHRKSFPDLEPLDYLDRVLLTSATIVQLREKDLSAEQLRPLVAHGVERARSQHILFLVNGEVGLALQEGADGAHLRSDQSLGAARQARRQSGLSSFVIGKSVHSVREAVAAEAEGADYVMLGPIFAPISKPSSIQPLGWSGLREAAQMLYIPVIAVGGMDASTWQDVLKTNALGGAGISWVRKEIEALV